MCNILEVYFYLLINQVNLFENSNAFGIICEEFTQLRHLLEDDTRSESKT